MPSVFVDDKIAKMIKLLQKQPCTQSGLVISTKMYRERVYSLIEEFHKAGLIFIENWDTIGRSRNVYPFFRWRTDPEQRDRPKPAPSTPQDSAYRAALRAQKKIVEKGLTSVKNSSPARRSKVNKLPDNYFVRVGGGKMGDR